MLQAGRPRVQDPIFLIAKEMKDDELSKHLWGEVSMCDSPPTLIIVHVGLVQHFIEGTVLQLTTGHW
jgi:hypothetical protein